MITFALSLIFGVTCGLRVSIVPFMVILGLAMVVTGAMSALVIGDSFGGVLITMALSSIAIQVGYVLGIWLRSLIE